MQKKDLLIVTEMALEESFFLRGARKTVVTNGCFRRIETPSADGSDLRGEFQTTVAKTLEDARKAGIENPLVCGAIPFDPSKPSALFVPKSWKTVENPFDILERREASDVQTLKTTNLQDHAGYTKSVSTAVDEIHDGVLDKVVLGRLRDIDISRPISSEDILARLAELNPQGFTFQVPLSNGERLVGASPELLIRQEGDRFYSQPLAGSAARSAEDDAKVCQDLFNSSKDRYEHKLVVDSMKTTLQPVAAELNVPDVPSLIATSKLWHLGTSISGSVADRRSNVLSLATLLHPTPALSGFPHEDARRLLTSLEPFDREYFGGIIGYCDHNGDGEWYVAIRCGKLSERSIRLFAGAGIVYDSDPESEWRETDVKLSTMMQALCPKQ